MKKHFITVILALLAETFALYGQSSLYFEALKDFQLEDYNSAISSFEREITDNPENDAAYYYLARALSKKGAPVTRVEECLKKAVELSPDNFWYRYTLAMFYSDTDRPELTTAMLEELISDFPKKSDLYFDAAEIYVSQNDIDKALETIDKIEKIRGRTEAAAMTKMDLMSRRPDANQDSIYAFLSDYYKDCKTPRIAALLGDYNARLYYNDSLALVYFNEAIDMDPSYIPAYYGKAALYQILNQYDKFFENLSFYIKDPASSPMAKVEYIGTLMESQQIMRKYSAQMDSLVMDLRFAHPKDSTVSEVLSRYYFNTGRAFLSNEILRQNMELYPESETAAMKYLILLYYQQAWGQIEPAATSLMQKFPTSVDIIQMRAIAFSQTDNYNGAISDYQSILALNPKDTTVLVSSYSALGDLYHNAGNSKKSYQCYEKALRYAPDYNLVLNNYAYFLSLDGKDLKKAKKMSAQTIQSEPDNPTYLDTYAWILHLLGENLEAKAVFKHAMLYGGKESAVILEHYATVLEALGEKDLASIYRNQAKAKNIE